ncbi:hypothetical protein MIMGU_mgv1a024428mg [Erythranthe guttata]|uniref:glucose-6-phosphate 1-epimerase n=1 Tax=Erythranthe guttata TaxID=4155 RepID=A0A022R256_ERYGU|nr:hypothetical protein MIMGU_mgv1a024428mg [Erythranthe guttata]
MVVVVPPPQFNNRELGGPSFTLNQSDGYSAEILLYGGQVISWKNARGEELLFVSENADYEHPHPLRGGIPICFPKFFDYGCVEGNGFARTRDWVIDAELEDSDLPLLTADNAFIDLILNHMPDDFPNWRRHRFELRLRVILGPTGDLTMISRVKNVNTNGRPFSFNFSFHTYFSVSNIKGYLNTSNEIFVVDHEIRRTFTIHKDDRLPDIVVWNPWALEARDTTDIGDEEYRKFICVEAAVVGSEITLYPGEKWTGTQRLSVHDWTDSDVLPDPGNIL